MLIGCGIAGLWILTAFFTTGVLIRWNGRDTEVGLEYGDLTVNSWHVPETHFDWWISGGPYAEDDRPTPGEAVFGALPYPTGSWNQPGVIDGFGIPIWNFLALWAGLFAWLFAGKRREDDARG